MSVLLVVVMVLAAGCGRGEPPDTAPVLLAEGRAGDQPWRLEGLLLSGEPCVTLVSGGVDRPAPSRCGVRRTALRHLDPMFASVGGRLLAFSPVPSTARRVRIDGTDGSIRTVPARPAPGFPARFFVAELPPGWEQQTIVRVFAGGGRALIA